MSDYLDRVEAQLTELTEKGAHQRLRARRGGLGPAGAGAGGPRPPRRGNEVLAFLAAAAVVAAVVAIVLFNGNGSTRHANASSPAHSSTTSTTTTTTATTTHSTPTVPGKLTGPVSLPIPAHFAPQSFTAIGELTWWLLGQAPCTFAGETPPCGEILRTTDGGRSFFGLEAPRATISSDGTSPASGYSQIRFAGTKNGFAYGPGLYATHDGGRSWHAVGVSGAVRDLEISSGEAYAIVTAGTTNAGQLMHSPVGDDDWKAVTAAGQVSSGLWVLGREVIVQSGNGGGPGTDLLVSQDGGGGFSRQPAPSPGLPCDFQAQSPQVIWAHCVTGTESGVWHSSDYITGFTPVHGAGLSPLPNSAVFAAASDTTAVVGYQRLYRTSDAGATWTAVTVPGVVQWTYLGFTDATHGVAIGYAGSVSPANERLYYTTDGGRSYHLVSLP